jgi:UPF0716 protein FxsA
VRWVVFLYPWLELWSLLALGSRTSAGMALLWVLAAGVLGAMLIRLAGAQTLGQLRTAQQLGSLQAQLLQDHVALAIVGLLLLIPGMVSDALAVLLLIRPLRSLIYRSVAPSERFSEEFSGGFRHTHHTHPPHPAHPRRRRRGHIGGGIRAGRYTAGCATVFRVGGATSAKTRVKS